MEDYKEVFKGNLDTSERTAFIVTNGDVSTMSLSPDGTMLASGNYSGDVKLYDASTGNLIRQTHDPETISIVNCVKWSPNGQFLAYSDGEGKIIVLNRNLETIKMIQSNAQADPAYTIDWNSASDAIVSGDGQGDVKIWNNVTTGPNLNADQASITMRISEMNDQHPNAEENIGPVISVAWCPTQEIVLSCAIDDDDGIKLFQYWEVHSPDGAMSGEELEYNEDQPYSAREMVWNHDGTHLAQACSDGRVRVERYDYNDFDAHNIEILPGSSNDSASSVAWSANGRFIVAGFFDNTVRVWEWPSKKLVSTLRGHTDSVTTVAISADGSTIFTGGLDHMIRKWSRSHLRATSHAVKLGQKNTGKLDFNKNNRALKYAPMPKSKIDYTNLSMSATPTLEKQYRSTIMARGVTRKKRHAKTKRSNKSTKKHHSKTHHKRSKRGKGKGKKHTKKHRR